MAEIIKKKISELKRHSVSLSLVSLALIIAITGMFAINGSLGWYAHNDEVSADGHSVSAKVSPNLVISKTEEGIRSQSNLTFGVNFGTSRDDMIAVTRDPTVPYTYLKYLDNHYAINHKTGVKKEGYELIFKPVPNDENVNEKYFIDHIVYIASAFKPLDVESLTANIIIPESVDSLHTYFNAASIDFYVDEVSQIGYRDTISVANREKSVEILKNGTVPLNTDDYIKVIMRCYFDGALEDGNGTAYVNSYSVKTDGVVIGVEFIATESKNTGEN